jgi:hypothetical protein
VGQNQPVPGLLNPDGFPKTNLQMMYPAIIQITGANNEIALPDFVACTDVDGFTVAVDFVSAMTFRFFGELIVKSVT